MDLNQNELSKSKFQKKGKRRYRQSKILLVTQNIKEMKKIILSLVIAGFSAVGMMASPSSQVPTNGEPKKERVENGKDGKKIKGDKKHDKKGDKKGDKKKGAGKFAAKQNNPFEGIELTETQKNQLKELRESLKPKKIEAETSNLTEEQKAQLKKEKKEASKNMRKMYLEGVKKILDEKQYIKFLENSYLQQKPGNGHKKKAKGPDPRIANKMQKAAK